MPAAKPVPHDDDGLPRQRLQNPARRQKSLAAKLARMTPEAVDALYRLAVGVWVEDEKTGRVYQTKPDRAAAQWIAEHALGKPTERTEVKQTVVTTTVDLSPAEARQRVLDLLDTVRDRVGGEPTRAEAPPAHPTPPPTSRDGGIGREHLSQKKIQNLN